MKANNKKLKSILMLVVLLVVIGCVSGFAYIACMSVGQDQSAEITQQVTQDTTTENTEAKQKSRHT